MATSETHKLTLRHENTTKSVDLVSVSRVSLPATTDDGLYHKRLSIGTGTTTITLATEGIAAGGRYILVNRDDTNFVEWGVSSGTMLNKLEAGGYDYHIGRLADGVTAIDLSADTAACSVEIWLMDA